MNKTTLSKEQLHQNAEALHALADGHPVQYWTDFFKAWHDTETVDCEFPHRVKPVEPSAQPTISTNVDDY